MAAGPNVVGFGCQARPKTLPTNVNSVGSCCSARGGVPLLCFWSRIAIGGVAFSAKSC